MAIKFSNLASTTLASGVTSTATSLSVTSASLFPTLGSGDYFYASIGTGSGSEVVKVTAVSGTTFTVVRGQDDTTAISHSSGVEVALRVTAASLNDLSAQADTESVSRDGDSMTGDLSFGDNDKAIFGAGSDLQIYHDGSHSYIEDAAGTGNLKLRTNTLRIENAAGTELSALFVQDGAATLYNDNTARLATTSYGVDITGRLVTTSHIDAPDNAKIRLGDGDDLQIYHDGSNSYVGENGTGDLRLTGNSITMLKADATETYAQFLVNGAVNLYYDNSAKLATTSTGIDVTGTVTADGLTVDGTVDVNLGSDGSNIASFSGASAGRKLDIQAFAVGASAGAGYSINATSGQGELDFQTTGSSRLNIDAGGDISFYEDTGTTAKLTWDASDESLEFADNAKATFGAGGDLEIYHSGSHSIIAEEGTGDLYLRSTNGDAVWIYAGGTTSSKKRLAAKSTGEVELYYGSTARLATTNTGIDVTGSVTADSLTVTGSDAALVASIGTDAQRVYITPDGTEINYNASGNSAGSHMFQTGNVNRLNIASNGDISFYEDTGSTAKLTWSASNESLTFGTNLAITTNEIDVATGDLTLDVAGDIILDADGGDIRLHDGGVLFGKLTQYQTDFYIDSSVTDRDMFFRGIDGGIQFVALTLDMSAAGAATFNSTIAAGAATFTTADNNAQLTLVSTDTDASVGPRLDLYRNSSSPANGDVIGEIQFQGEDTVGSLNIFATISSQADQVNNGAEDGSLRFKTLHNGTLAERITIAQNNHVIINETGVDADFRVESDTDTHALFVQGSDGYVGVGGAPSAKLQVSISDATEYSTTEDSELSPVGTDALFLYNGESTSTNGKVSILMRNAGGGGSAAARITLKNERSGSGGLGFFFRDNDHTSEMREKVYISSDGLVTHSGLTLNYNTSLYTADKSLSAYSALNGVYLNGNASGWLQLAGDGNRNTRMNLFGDGNGAANQITFHTNNVHSATLGAGGIIFNETGADRDFRVESDSNSHALFVNAGNENVSIKSAGYTTSTDLNLLGAGLSIKNDKSGNSNNWSLIQNTATSSTANLAFTTGAGVALTLNHDTSATFNSNITSGGHLELSQTGNFATTGLTYHTNGWLYARGGDSGIILKNRASTVEMMRIKPTEVVINDDGIADLDFRVESDSNTRMLFVDGGNDRVGIGGAPSARMEIISDGSDAAGAHLRLTHANNNTNDVIATLNFGNNAGSAARIRASTTGANNTGLIQFFADNAGTDSQVASFQAEKVVFNETGNNQDFRVESDSNANAIFLDASTNRLNIFGASGSSTVDIVTGNGSPGDSVVGVSIKASDTNLTEKLNLGVNSSSTNAFINAVKPGTDNIPLSIQALGGGVIFNENGSASGDFRVESDSNTHALFVDGGANHVNIGTSTDYGGTLNVNDSIYVAETDSPRIRLRNIGNSDTELGVNGLSAGLDTFYIAQYAGIAANEWDFRLTGASREFAFIRGGVVNEGAGDSDFRVESSGNANMLFVDAGNDAVCVGTATQQATFTVSENQASNFVGHFKNSHASAYGLGIDTGSGNQIFFYVGGANKGSIVSNSSGTTYNTTSDRRLKDNIETITDGTDKLMAMNPVTHGWKADPEADAVHGFIAQEIMDIVPEAVSGDPEGEEMMSMDYGRITPVLVAALQDAHNKIEALETRLATLEDK